MMVWSTGMCGINNMDTLNKFYYIHLFWLYFPFCDLRTHFLANHQSLKVRL